MTESLRINPNHSGLCLNQELLQIQQTKLSELTLMQIALELLQETAVNALNLTSQPYLPLFSAHPLLSVGLTLIEADIV